MSEKMRRLAAVALALVALGCDDDGAVDGCGRDIDCRGDRVCVARVCVDPDASVQTPNDQGRADVGATDAGAGGADASQLDGSVLDAAADGSAVDGMLGDAEAGDAGADALLGDAALDAQPVDALIVDAEPVACTDLDGDGYGNGPMCRGLDCDDDNPAINPDAVEVAYDGIDQDCDGADIRDQDGDGFDAVAVGGRDCDDGNQNIHPDAFEIPGDGTDQNCDGSDESPVPDADGDGHDSISAGGDDCDDQSPGVHPGAEEIPYDGIDQDCQGGDLTDFDEDGDDAIAAGGRDCDDLNPEISSQLREVLYNNRDDDCNPETPDSDLDGDGFLAPEGGGQDCDDENPAVNPGAEEIPYNDRDDDCDPQTRDNDLDFDGFDQPEDCDDSDPNRNPNQAEVPGDGIDQDCDGRADEPPGEACPGHEDMVALAGFGCVDQYEASRADATPQNAGFAGGLAHSVPGVLPWTNVTLQQARDACAAAGKALCGQAAWNAACDAMGQRYPYGFEYDAGACNTVDGAGTAAGTGSFPRCIGRSGAFDLSGNVAEWVDEENAQLGTARISGGSYQEAGADAACGVAFFEAVDSAQPWLGFRCCTAE
jgi:hypothetical protein